jgi:hypothetical protein
MRNIKLSGLEYYENFQSTNCPAVEAFLEIDGQDVVVVEWADIDEVCRGEHSRLYDHPEIADLEDLTDEEILFIHNLIDEEITQLDK